MNKRLTAAEKQANLKRGLELFQELISHLRSTFPRLKFEESGMEGVLYVRNIKKGPTLARVLDVVRTWCHSRFENPKDVKTLDAGLGHNFMATIKNAQRPYYEVSLHHTYPASIVDKSYHNLLQIYFNVSGAGSNSNIRHW